MRAMVPDNVVVQLIVRGRTDQKVRAKPRDLGPENFRSSRSMSARPAGAVTSSRPRTCEAVRVVLEDWTPDGQRKEEEKEEITGEHNLEWPGSAGCLC